MQIHGNSVWEMANSSANWTVEDAGLSCLENRTVFIVCTVFFVFTFISSVGGNALVIGCIMKFRRLRRRNVNFLIGSLAFSNMLIAGLSPFEFIRVFYPGTSKKLICCLIYFAVVVTLMGSAGGNFLIISFERFIAVMFPFRHRTLLTRSRLKIMISVNWIISVFFACVPLFGWNNSTHIRLTAELKFCSIDAIIPVTIQKILVAVGVVHVLANLVLFIPVLYVACKRSKETRKHSNEWANTGLTKLLAYTFATFSISWCPFHVSTVVALLYKGPLAQCAHQWSIHVGLIHSAVDWMIYGLGNKTFRKAFKQMLLRRNSKRLDLGS